MAHIALLNRSNAPSDWRNMTQKPSFDLLCVQPLFTISCIFTAVACLVFEGVVSAEVFVRWK